MNAQDIIDYFGMRPLPEEGGYYVETYRAKEQIARVALPTRYEGTRSFCTAILYLITPESCSKFHRVKSDELFHFYLGDPVELVRLHKGEAILTTLGHDFPAGHALQALVPHGQWQGCRLLPGGRYALLGCTVAPGFEFQDFESARTEDLIRQFPAHTDLIRKMT